MKIIDNNKSKTLVLDDNDTIYLETLKRNPIILKIECNDGVILIDELPLKKLKMLQIEEKELKKLKEYNKNNLKQK